MASFQTFDPQTESFDLCWYSFFLVIKFDRRIKTTGTTYIKFSFRF